MENESIETSPARYNPLSFLEGGGERAQERRRSLPSKGFTERRERRAKEERRVKEGGEERRRLGRGGEGEEGTGVGGSNAGAKGRKHR